jgi:6-phosphogluconate dehydrogenase
VDAGTSGGVWGAERGYCLMIGGEKDVVQRIDPIFSALAPSVDSAPRTPGREKVGGTAEHGYLHCGPSGAGHFVKMVHNGIEYGIMASYAEGLNILHHANAGKQQQTVDAETTPLRNPEVYRYDLNLADIAEVWRRGSVISSWILDLAAASLLESPDLAKLRAACRTREMGAGRSPLQSTSRFRLQCSARLCMSASVHVAKTVSPIRCYPRCDSNLAATKRKPARKKARDG